MTSSRDLRHHSLCPVLGMSGYGEIECTAQILILITVFTLFTFCVSPFAQRREKRAKREKAGLHPITLAGTGPSAFLAQGVER